MKIRHFILVILLGLCVKAHAHPHVFMDYRVNVGFDKNTIQSIKVSWIYDLMYSRTRWSAFDENHDGKFDAGELQKLTQNEKSILMHDGDFTWIKIDGKKIPLNNPKDFTISMENKLLRCTFTIDCNIPIPNGDHEIRVAVYDPEYFYQLTYQDENPVTITGNTLYQINGTIQEDPKETYYYGQLHPDEIILKIHPSANPQFTMQLEAPKEGQDETPLPQWYSAPIDDTSSPTPAQQTVSTVPRFIIKRPNSFLDQISVWQRQLKDLMAVKVDEAKQGHSYTALFFLLGLAFIYGIIHAAGPGHGKIITMSYFLTDEPNLLSGLVFGNLVAIFHGLSGVVCVLIAHLFSQFQGMNDTYSVDRYMEPVSYAFVILMGIWLLQRVLKDKGCGCGFHGDHHHHVTKPDLALAFSTGIIPCPGTMMIMVFCMAAGVTAIGIWMALWETLGMAMTISAIGLLTIMGKKLTLGTSHGFSDKINYALSIGGAFLIIAFGALMFLASFPGLR